MLLWMPFRDTSNASASRPSRFWTSRAEWPLLLRRGAISINRVICMRTRFQITFRDFVSIYSFAIVSVYKNSRFRSRESWFRDLFTSFAFLNFKSISFIYLSTEVPLLICLHKHFCHSIFYHLLFSGCLFILWILRGEFYLKKNCRFIRGSRWVRFISLFNVYYAIFVFFTKFIVEIAQDYLLEFICYSFLVQKSVISFTLNYKILWNIFSGLFDYSQQSIKPKTNCSFNTKMILDPLQHRTHYSQSTKFKSLALAPNAQQFIEMDFALE